jgi:hypothetical protein
VFESHSRHGCLCVFILFPIIKSKPRLISHANPGYVIIWTLNVQKGNNVLNFSMGFISKFYIFNQT